MKDSQYSYDKEGGRYANYRRTDPRIAKYVHGALGDAKKVINVGASAGSYEPADKYVIAVEPSAVMRAQRPPNCVPAVNGAAESLPFDDNSFDAGMAMVTVHHWSDQAKGLKELRRVSKGAVVILTFDPNADAGFWLTDYAPEIKEVDKMRYKPMEWYKEVLGGKCIIQAIPVAIDCIDGIQEAFYARPAVFLDENVRGSQSTWKFLPPGAEERAVKALAEDLETGEWERKYGSFRSKPEIISSLRLIINTP